MNYTIQSTKDTNLVYAWKTGADNFLPSALRELVWDGCYMVTGAPAVVAGLYTPGATVRNLIDGTEYLNVGSTAVPSWKLVSHA